MRADWDYKTLGEIGKVSMCKRILKKQTTATGEIPFYKIGTFGKVPDAFISKEVFEDFKLKYSFPKKGEVLISASGTIGRRVVYDGKPAYFQDSNIVWIANNETEVSNEYLYAFYGHCDWNPSKGATISRLYNDDLRKIKIPIPPLPEQKQIVSILDKAFAAIDQAKANIERNIENAKELFQSKLNEIFSQKGDGWEEKQWKEVLEIRSGRNQKEVEDKNGKYPIIGSAGKIMGYANDYICEEGTTIIGRKGTINNPMYFENKFWNVDTAFGLHALKGLDKKFLYFFCLSYDFTQRDKGSGRPSLVKNDLLTMEMGIPSIAKQIEIVSTCESLKNKVVELEQHYSNKLIVLEELKKSILQKAFAGELTEKNINLENIDMAAEPVAPYQTKNTL